MTDNNNNIHAILVRPPNNEPESWIDDDPCWGSARQNGLAELTKVIHKSRCVLYESENYIAIDKPPDLRMDGCYKSTVHKLTTYWYPSQLLSQQSDLLRSVESYLHRHNYLKDNELRPIHQLDYPTSGVLLVGRNKKATSIASDSFLRREAKKSYLAIVHGHVSINEEWPALEPARLQTISEIERVYKKKRNPKFQRVGDTFQGFLPPSSAFVKWISVMKRLNNTSELDSKDVSKAREMQQTIYFLKKQRLERRQKKGTVLEPHAFEKIIEECVHLTEADKQQLLTTKWAGVRVRPVWLKTFERLADRYNLLLKEKNDNVLNPSPKPLPRLFRVQGDVAKAFYIHAACAQIKDRYKMTLHPDALPFDNALLSPDDQMSLLDFKPALTRCIILGRGYLNGHPVTKVQLEPHTGRRHQLRLHMVVAGNPIVGDISYESPSNPKDICPRMCLHAYKLSLTLVGGRREFVAPDPFQEVYTNENTKEKTFVAKIPGKKMSPFSSHGLY